MTEACVVVSREASQLLLMSFDKRPHSQVFLFPILFAKLPVGEALTAQQACDRIMEAFREYLASEEFEASPADAIAGVRQHLDQLYARYLVALLNPPLAFVQEAERRYLGCREEFLRNG